MDSACHVIGCHLSQETNQGSNAFDDVAASNIHQTLAGGAGRRGGGGGAGDALIGGA